MAAENTHPLVEILAGLIKKEKQGQPAIKSLQETFRHIGVENISHVDINNIGDIIDTSAIEQRQPKEVSLPSENENVHVFARTSPVRSSQLKGGFNQFLPGTAANSIGPISINRQPPFFIDFIRTQRSVALFMQGNPNPILYFKIKVKNRAGLIIIPKVATYELIPTSVWIQAKSLHQFVSAELYAGLKISSGTLQIVGDFTTSQTGITLSPGATFTCDLKLVQKELPTNVTTSQYGKDALDAGIQLPAEFSFNNNGVSKVGSVNTTIFGNKLSAPVNTAPNIKYFEQQKRIGFSLNLAEDPLLTISETQSPLIDINGQAPINTLWWALPLAEIQLLQPLEADGNGALLIECGEGLAANIKNTDNQEIYLKSPQFLIEPGRINMTDSTSNGSGKSHNFSLWQEEEKFATDVNTKFLKDVPFIFNTLIQGTETLDSFAGFSVNADRPLNIQGEAVALRTEKGVLTFIASETETTIYLADYELLIDKKPSTNNPLPTPKKMALALSNALLTTTLPASVLLQAKVSDDFTSLTEGNLEIYFGLYAYLPTLPDPYVANLGIIKRQLRTSSRHELAVNNVTGTEVWMWVIATVKWSNEAKLLDTSFELVDYNKSKIVNNFRLPFVAPNPQEINAKRLLFTPEQSDRKKVNGDLFKDDFVTHNEVVLGDRTIRREDINPVFSDFALLDVSSNANQLGVAFSHMRPYIQQLANNGEPIVNDTDFPLKIDGVSVTAVGKHAQAFTMPGIAWEPLLTIPLPTDVPAKPGDPQPGFNYFPNDGLPTIMGNLSEKRVTLAPIPLSKHLVETFENNKDGKTYALFNLPFGMLAFAILNQNNENQKIKPSINNVLPEFENAIVGGVQLELVAGSSFDNDNGQGLFEGYTIQIANLYDQVGYSAKSTLGESPTKIFNNEFLNGGYTPEGGSESKLENRPGVPVTGIGISGYGTSMASKWANDEAVYAQVSKAEFNVYTGRTSHELVQVVSKEYPFGSKMVRTITIFRMSNGYVARVDSGWKSQSPGLYDFSYLDDKTRLRTPSPFDIHPGVVKGVFNIRNIKEVDKPTFKESGNELQAITYDADILIENVFEGGKEQKSEGMVLVSSSGVLGYLQLQPTGSPISTVAFTELLKSEGGSIGGPINCIVKIAGTDQHIKLNRFDVSPSVDGGGNSIFVASSRGSAFLPKDGSWSLVQHKIGNGNVTPLPAQFSVPIIKEGLRPKFDKPAIAGELFSADPYNPLKDINPDALHRIADPANLIVTDPAANNYGFLQNLGSQKVLFLTPSFKTGTSKLLSKTPPLLADSFKLLNSNGIFPNIGDAATIFGEAVSLLKGAPDGFASVEAFVNTGWKDLGKDVYEIMDLNLKKEGDKFIEQGYKLAKKTFEDGVDKILKFDIPDVDYKLVNLEDKLVIAIRYKSSSKAKGEKYSSKYDFDVNSLTDIDNWKGKLNNLAIVVSVGPMKELMTVKGNFNAQKGKDLDLGGNDIDNGFTLPTPEIEFSDEVQPVIEILELLAKLSTGDYAGALKKGLKVAMSNSGDIWEYKMEATKEIPLVRFPPGPLYDSPQTPLKLECSLQIGFYVNAALKVTTDLNQLLPTAGAFFAFRGRLMVMCFSVGAGSIYATGEAGIKLKADTSPNVEVILHFGFGAQIAVGLPVVATVSVTFMIGVEMSINSNGKIAITAFMIYKGQAELLGGIVCICIMIEAHGTVIKLGPETPTNCEVEVSFAIDVSIFLVINIHFSESWSESRQIA